MNTRLLLFLALSFLPIFSWAQDRGDLPNAVPNQFEGMNLMGYKSYQFSGFGLGISNDLPVSEQERLLQVVADEVNSDRIIFIQGVADTTRWRDHEREDHRVLDFNLGMDRARFGLDKIRARFPEVVERVRLLSTSRCRDVRGVNLFVATYGFVNERRMEPQAPYDPLKFPDLKVGGFIGTSFVHTKGMNFFVPTAGLLIKGNIFEVSFFGGWRPTSEHKDGLEGRAESIVGADLTLHGDRWFGFSAGGIGAWETLRYHDYDYMKRAWGFYIGPKFFMSSENFSIKTSPNFQMLKLDRYGRNDEWWDIGYGLSVEFLRFFN